MCPRFMCLPADSCSYSSHGFVIVLGQSFPLCHKKTLRWPPALLFLVALLLVGCGLDSWLLLEKPLEEYQCTMCAKDLLYHWIPMKSFRIPMQPCKQSDRLYENHTIIVTSCIHPV